MAFFTAARSKRRFCLLFVFPLLLCACKDHPAPAEEGPEIPKEAAVPAEELPKAIVKTGADPFWFELVRGGPQLIPSPRYASLEPFAPWKLARRITAFLAEEETLTAPVNQEGFLVFKRTNAGEISFFYCPNPAWEGYSVSSEFWYEEVPSGAAPQSAAGPLWGKKAAVLLARDRIFGDPGKPPAASALWYFDSGGTKALELPAIAGNVFETENIFWDSKNWYVRGRQIKNGSALYFKTGGLEEKAESIPYGAFLEASKPLALEAAPAPLAETMKEAARLAGKPCVFKTTSPDFRAPLSYQLGLEEGITELVPASAWYRSGNGGGEALVLLPDGRGTFKTGVHSGSFALPPLPENYVWTGAGLLSGGNILIAAWEEQAEWNVGAAGFVMLEINLQK